MKNKLLLLLVGVALLPYNAFAYGHEGGMEGDYSIPLGLGTVHPDFLGNAAANGAGLVNGMGFKIAPEGSFPIDTTGGTVNEKFGGAVTWSNHTFGIGVGDVYDVSKSSDTLDAGLGIYLKPIYSTIGVSAEFALAPSAAANSITPSILINPMGKLQLAYSLPINLTGTTITNMTWGIAYMSDMFGILVDVEDISNFTSLEYAPAIQVGSHNFHIGAGPLFTQGLTASSFSFTGVTGGLSIGFGKGSFIVVGAEYISSTPSVAPYAHLVIGI